MSKPGKQAILKAIKGTGGIMSQISRSLNVTWHTAKAYTEQYAETRQALEDERNTIIDMAESALFMSIKGGDTQDAKWLLSRLAKDRGYVERTQNEISGKDGGPIEISNAREKLLEMIKPADE